MLHSLPKFDNCCDIRAELGPLLSSVTPSAKALSALSSALVADAGGQQSATLKEARVLPAQGARGQVSPGEHDASEWGPFCLMFAGW